MKGWLVAIGAVAALLTTAIILKHRPPPSSSPSQPVAAMYSNLAGNGSPFAPAGVIDSAACREQARYDAFIIDPEARDGAKRQALAYIRSLAPHATMLGYFYASEFYVCGSGYYGQAPPPYGCDTTQLAWKEMRLVTAYHGVLFNRSGTPLSSTGGIQIDYAAPGLARALADLFADWLAGSGSFSGAFTDGPCTSIAGFYPGNQCDYARQGWLSMAAWDSAYTAGVLEYHRELKARVGMVVGNCGPSGPTTANGWMGENFPHQNPATFEAWDSVLTVADTAYSAPQLSFITTPRPRWQGSSGWQVALFSDPDVQRQLRFVLGSAALHDHVAGVLVGSPFDGGRGFMPDQWSDLYHCLGSPQGKQSIVSGGVHRREFSQRWLFVNPTPFASKQTIHGATVIVPAMDASFVAK